MNPYKPVKSCFVDDCSSESSRQSHAARLLLFPIGAFCLLFFAVSAFQLFRTQVAFRTADFLEIGATILVGIFGLTGVCLSVGRLSQHTRRMTQIWSCSLLCLIAVSLLFEHPVTVVDTVMLLASVFAVALVGILSSRTRPQVTV